LRITEVNNSECPLKVGDVISNAEYQKARTKYECPVKVGDQLILEKWNTLVIKWKGLEGEECPAKLGEQITPKKWETLSNKWEGLKAESFLRITEVNNSECPLKVGDVISNAEYQKARTEYECPVKVGDSIIRTERVVLQNLERLRNCARQTHYQSF
jgi:co-chaperonin GroES (HSP10)